MRPRRLLFAASLLLAAPALPELLTGSTPFTRFLSPIPLLVLVSVYGVPALLIREYLARRRLGYHYAALLGVATGVLVEGLCMNTLYDPRIDRLGDYAWYGRMLGVNWPWLIYILLFHSLYSAAAPIMFVEAFFPEEAGRPLLPAKAAAALAAIPAASPLLFRLDENVYQPPPRYHAAAAILLVIYIYLVSRLSIAENKPGIPEHPAWPPRLLFLYPPLLIIAVFYGLEKILPPQLHAALAPLLYIPVYNTLRRTRRGDTGASWSVSSMLILGLCITGYAAAILDRQLHIAVPASFFTALIAYTWMRGGPGATCGSGKC